MNQHFLNIYKEIVSFSNINDSTKEKVYLNQPQHICRFCGRQKPDVSFNDEAHAISANAGNNTVLSNYECDECNHIFGNTYEDSFGKYILPFKIISQIFGRKPEIKHKDVKNNTFSIKIKKSGPVLPLIDDNISALIVDKGDMYSITPLEDNSGFVFNLTRQKYIPEYVYLSLLKMAYSIMPLQLLANFKESLVYLKLLLSEEISQEDRNNIINSYPNAGFLGFTSGIDRDVNATLYLKSQDSDSKYPMCVFILKIGNFLLQIPVPSDSQRNHTLSLPQYFECEESTISTIDFHKVEYDFNCEFKSNIQEINFSTEMKEKIIDELQKNKIINTEK